MNECIDKEISNFSKNRLSDKFPPEDVVMITREKEEEKQKQKLTSQIEEIMKEDKEKFEKSMNWLKILEDVPMDTIRMFMEENREEINKETERQHTEKAKLLKAWPYGKGRQYGLARNNLQVALEIMHKKGLIQDK